MSSRPDNKTRDEILASLPEEAWIPAPELSGVDYVRSYTVVDIGGVPTEAWRTQYLADDDLQALNKHDFSESEGKRWGDGKVVARVPLNVLFDPKHQIAEKQKEGDRDHMKWWLDSEAAKPFRTFKGRIS